jgi:microcystin-dependent protein
MFGGNFAPAGWEFCDGRHLAISENETLFQLIGTTYGGDGEENFALPDLRGRAPVHLVTATGQGPYILGEAGGIEAQTLGANQIPVHSHALIATQAGGANNSPAGNLPAANNSPKLYLKDVPTASIAANAVTPVGGSQPHDNMQPYIVITYIISLFGIFPSAT